MRYASLPSGLACYPRVVLTDRPALESVHEPAELHARVDRVLLDDALIRRYAHTCGFDPTNGIPVTFPHVLAMPLHLKIFASAAFALKPMGLIHLSNVIEAPGVLQAGKSFQLDVAARNYRQMDAGLAFDMDSQLSNHEGVVWRETCVFMSRWPESMQRATGRPPRPPKAPKDAEVLCEINADLRKAWDYARVSKDFNPIHLNDRAARFFGLRGAISHGMWSLARALAERPLPAPPSARLETQFLTPVQLPARVNVKQWLAEGETKRAMCDVRTGRVHMYAYWTQRAADSGEATRHEKAPV